MPAPDAKAPAEAVKGKAMKTMKARSAKATDAEVVKGKTMKAIKQGLRAAQLLVAVEEAAGADVKGEAMKAARRTLRDVHSLMKHV